MRRPIAAALAVGCGLGLAACGGFDSRASGEHLIRDYVKRFGQGRVSVKSVSCPSGVAEKDGGTYTCRVVLHDRVTGKDHPGTITVHMIATNKVGIQGGQDVHVS
jgi:hypothetical protein